MRNTVSKNANRSATQNQNKNTRKKKTADGEYVKIHSNNDGGV